MISASAAQAQQGQAEKEQPTSNIPTLEETKAPDPGGPAAPVDPGSYVIGAEDQLSVSVWKEPEVSRQVIVRPDGKITMPLIGEVQASGKTPVALAQQITEKLGEFINRPEVLVEVRGVRSKKYYITGQVNRTGAFSLTVPTTVLEALSGTGGFQQWAKKKKIIIIRGDKRFRFNYNDVIEGKNMQQNIYLENGDLIVVP
ncbi:MAG: polysaccharide biosynthesis/export family protein [Bryobacteraceae bacterium]|nr:polysaccharide biosynthesis/export family protein [Bryobacteraceae bacterium]